MYEFQLVYTCIHLVQTGTYMYVPYSYVPYMYVNVCTRIFRVHSSTYNVHSSTDCYELSTYPDVPFQV